MSPNLKVAYFSGKETLIHDPFKSDIYSLGLILALVFLTKMGKNFSESKKILVDPE